jgi:RNA polymerase sigma factor (sigma-70 family)
MGSRRSGELFGHLETLFRIGTVVGLSDAELLERFVAGRDEAGEANFRALVARHGPMVLRVCRSVLDDPHDAEDAFQVTFLALARKAGSIRKHGSLGSWLHGTALRVAKKAQIAARRRLARESRVAEARATIASASQPSIDDTELMPILHEEIERLPANYRAPIVLCYLEGMTHDQAALELGWPVGTVRGRLARARDLLRSRLTRRGLALAAGLEVSGSLADAAFVRLPATLVEATVGAAIGGRAFAGMSRTALLLKDVLRDMALTRCTQLGAPLLLIALCAGGATVFLSPGGSKLSVERLSATKARPVPRPAPTDLTGDPLPDGALARLGTTRFLHAAHVNHVAYSPDGGALASSDGSVYFWDPATGRERRRVETGMVRAFAYAPDGQSLAVQVLDVRDPLVPGKPRPIFPETSLIDAVSGREIRRFEGEGTASCLAFSSDGKVLARAIESGPSAGITLWDVASGHVLRSMGRSFAGTISLAFSPEGKVLIACVPWLRDQTPFHRQQRDAVQPPAPPDESSIQLWDLATGKEIRRIGMGKTRITHAVVAPDGRMLATAASDKTIRLWDLASGREIRRFGGSDSQTYAIMFSPDGTNLVTTEGLDPEFPNLGESPPLTTPLHIWDTATGRELRQWKTDSNSLACFSPDGTTLTTVGGNVIRLWDAASGREIRPPARRHSAIGDAVFTPDGRSVVTVDRTIHFWDPSTGKEIRQLEGSGNDIGFASFSADGKLLVTGYGFQPTRLWDVAAGRELRQFQTPGKIQDTFVSCADLSPDGKMLATSVSAGVIFWDTTTGERRAGVAESRIGHSMIKALRVAPDGKSVATIDGDWVGIWEVATGRETRRLALPNKVPNDGFSTIGAKLVYSPDGTILVATSARDGLIFLLDLASGRELGRLDGPANRFKALAFSPDGKVLATGVDMNRRFPGRELAIRLWDVAAGKELGRVKAHRASITALAFSPDGRRLVSASEDATALVWDVAALTGRGNAGSPAVSASRQEGDRKTP